MEGEHTEQEMQEPGGDTALPPQTNPVSSPKLFSGTSPRKATRASSTTSLGDNGHTVNADLGKEDEVNNYEDLTPPPDSPVEEARTPALSAPTNALADEIVVGTNTSTNGEKSSPQIASSEPEDVEMTEGDENENEAAVSSYPKRKRLSVSSELSAENVDSPVLEEEVAPASPTATSRPMLRPHGLAGSRGVILGYWRDSDVSKVEDKHAVIGFIDIRDRLRTRIQSYTRSGKPLGHKNPIPGGPGGSWVTFDGIAFDDHLVSLDHEQVKQYVKVRTELAENDETEKQRNRLNKEAVKEALRRVQANPSHDSSATPLIAYGAQLPEHAQTAHRPESKKRRLAPAVASSAKAKDLGSRQRADISPSTSPTRIVVGYWKHSGEEDDADKHAVFGVLGANGMLRAKLTRQTRDGRPVVGNFPTGAGALWIHWDDVVLEPHLQHLSRAELKDYCRIRQAQLDRGERPSQKSGNELAAAAEAQGRNAGVPEKPVDSPSRPSGADIPVNGADSRRPIRERPASSVSRRESDKYALREPRREVNSRGRHSLPDSQLRASARPQNNARLERANSLARREVARVEAAQVRADQRAASREAAATNKSLFQDHVQRLNKVWVAQEVNRLKGGSEDAKIYMGIKYERKQTGPFEGKLVSQGTIISIDGEDYVEYRVLTKPTFV